MAVLALVSGGAASAATWEPAVPFSASVISPKVAIAPDGSAIAIWREETATDGCSPYTTDPGCEVRAAHIAADGSQGEPVTLSAGDAYYLGYDLVIDGQGVATAIWVETDGGSFGSSVHMRRLVDGAWGAAERLSATGLQVYSTRIVVNDDDEVLAVWSDEVAHAIDARRYASGAWQARAGVPDGAGVLGVVEEIVALPDGTFLLSFRRTVSLYDRVATARFAAGAWTDEGQRSSGADVANAYTNANGMTVDGAGVVTLAWYTYLSSRYVIQVARRAADGTWGAVETVTRTSAHEQSPQVVASDDGTVTMVWRGMGADFNSAEVARSARFVSGAWAALPDIGASTRTSLVATSLGLDADRRPAFLVDQWNAAISRWPSSLVTWEGSGWSSPAAIAPSAGWRASGLVFGAGGNGLVVGQDWPSPASLRAYVVVPSAPLNVRGEAGDGVARVAWDAPDLFGGAPITGYTVTADPGGRTCTTTDARVCTIDGLVNGATYRFTVVAANAAGSGPVSTASAGVTPTATPAPAPGPEPAPDPEPAPEIRTPRLPRTGPPMRMRIRVEVPSAGTLRVIGMSHHRGRAKPIWRCTFVAQVERVEVVPAVCRLRARARAALRRGPVRFTFVAVHRSVEGVVTETRSTVTVARSGAR